jgi:protein-ribulosamine 3-kinase
VTRTVASIADALSDALGPRFDDRTRKPVSGGSINAAYRYTSAQQSVFVKVSSAAQAQMMFEAESAGLRALEGTQAIRVPRVIARGLCKEGAFLALEWLNFGPRNRSAEATLGKQLAWQHRSTHSHYGWNRDNTIGSTPQVNTPSRDWVEFYRERRLKAQLDLAARANADAMVLERGYRLCEVLPAFFSGYQPAPSLLHGDLWGGNWSCDEEGMPVVFDPAVYYGDREADIAMTRLFGGFGPAFYTAYQSTWPLDPGAQTRVALYNLYHVLNHHNLFGGGYLGQAALMIEGLLAEVRG